jgi:hypothetical protein
MKMWKEWASSIWRCRKNGDHPYEDLAKSNYKPNVKYQSIIIFLYSWLYAEKTNIEIWWFGGGEPKGIMTKPTSTYFGGGKHI